MSPRTLLPVLLSLLAVVLVPSACSPPGGDDAVPPGARQRITGDVDLDDLGVLLAGPAAGGEAGTSVSAPGDLDGDGFDDLAVGVPGLEDGRGGVQIWFGSPLGPSASNVLLGVLPGDRAGTSVAGVGDATGDGLPDLLVGAPGAGVVDDQQGDASTLLAQGAAFLVDSGFRDGSTIGGSAATFLGEAAGDCAGRTVGAPGDVDGDGLADLLVGAPCRGSHREWHQHVQAWMLFDGPGSAYLVLGGSSGEVPLSSAAARFDGERTWDRFGTALVGLPDQDGDGFPDLAIGSPDYYGAVWINQDARGRVFVFSGSSRGVVPTDEAWATILGGWGGAELHDELGRSLSAGAGGLLAGAPSLRDYMVQGGAFLVRSLAPGSSEAWEGDVVVTPPQDFVSTRAGTAVLADLDLDCDAEPDVVMGAPEELELGPRSGGVRVGYGPWSGYLDLGIEGLHALGAGSEQAGAALESADLDGDGCGELLAGAPGSHEAGTSAGGTWWIELPELEPEE